MPFDQLFFKVGDLRFILKLAPIQPNPIFTRGNERVQVAVGRLPIQVAILRMNLAISLVDSLYEAICRFADIFDLFRLTRNKTIQAFPA